jgi:hypothetical protein
VSFFPPDPTDDEIEDIEQTQSPWWRPSDDEHAAIFPIGETIVSNDSVAVILSMARVYSNGVEFVIDRRVRRGGADLRAWRQMQSKIQGMFGQYDPDRLRYGVALGDGQRVIVDQGSGRFGEAPDTHSLVQTGGGGGGSNDTWRFEDGLWLWPLPPEGPLEVVVQWPAFGVPESHAVLDSAPLRELASRARPVWGE